MTIQEAIKSGKPFRRHGGDDIDWLSVNVERGLHHIHPAYSQQEKNVLLLVADILATDWEIKP